MSDQFTALAPHLQIVVGVLTVTGAGIWGVVKFFKPFIDSVSKDPGMKPTDAVVLSAAFADTKPMAELTAAIIKLCESQDEANKHSIKRAIIDEMLLEAITRLIHKP